MKRVLSLFLALVMVVLAVPALALVVSATEGEEPSSTYLIYHEDFESLTTADSKSTILQKLGWYVPEDYIGSDVADYSAVDLGTGADSDMALHISTKQPAGMEKDSVVTILNNDVMSIVRAGSFTLSYELTYRAGTTNANGFASLLYNFNEQFGTLVSSGEFATYGIVAVRPCGTGMNGVFYPVNTLSRFVSIEDAPNAAANVLANRYMQAGDYPSLAGRLGVTEDATTVRAGSLALIDTTLNVTLEYVCEKGVNVYINGMLVSSMIATNRDVEFNTETWGDFITRTEGSALAILTEHNIEADIDDIRVESKTLTDIADTKMPELLITEVAAGPKTGWAEYIELYNPTDDYVDLSEYSILYADNVYEGAANAELTDDRYAALVNKKYTKAFNIGDYIGKTVCSNTAYYLPEDQLKNYQGRYVFFSTRSTVDDGLRYAKVGAAYQPSDSGTYCKIYFCETWNERYQKYNADGSLNEDVATNTMLAPGECLLIFMMTDTTEAVWKNGVNAGRNESTTTAFSASTSFRQQYQNYGLDSSTKVICANPFNLANNTQRYFYVAKTENEQGVKIGASSLIKDTKDQIVSYAEYAAPIVCGSVYEGEEGLDTGNEKTFGVSGTTSEGFSAVYLYGVDANDAKRGTLYTNLSPVNHARKSHVGSLSGYQILLFEEFYRRKNDDPAALMITEIIPRTNNLLGEDDNAFPAMEITNTSAQTINLYRYSLVATEIGAECSPQFGFTRFAEMRAGNPINKGVYNGAYYYFVENHISNPETCYIAPGESVVVWFLTEGTYASYATDEEFGFDYFRQYWADNGNERLAMKDANGAYLTKVVAVDGTLSETLNADNFMTAFRPEAQGSALYGIALASAVSTLKSNYDPEAVYKASVPTSSVQSMTFLGAAAVHYVLSPIEVESGNSDDIYLVNELSFTIPANKGMRYAVGITPITRCSAMINVQKTQYYNFNNSYKYYVESIGSNRVKLQFYTTSAAVDPALGKLSGKEIYPLLDSYITEKTEGNVTTYYVNDTSRLNVQTLQGAGLSTKGATAQLRFDAMLPSSVYASVVSTCGAANVEIGALIVESSLLGDMKNITKAKLDEKNIAYADVDAVRLYNSGAFTVVGAYLAVDAAKYGTDYTAIHYITYTLPDGTTKTLWSGATAEESVKDAAEAALDDLSNTQTAEYAYSNGNGKFSRYTATVQAKLRAYLGA